MPTVRKIDATINPLTRLPQMQLTKRRVAGYARVSTDSDEQFTSYAAQVDYYTNFIKRNPEWDFVNVYTDEGISGTNTKKRDSFNLMIKDALNGKIDLIITKSVSRFARNTVDSLVTIRKLKDHNVEVYFEKENIYTFDGKGELLISIMSSLAQEESRSISENVTWGQRKRFADEKVSLPYKQFLGYEKGEDELPKVVPEQAEIVRDIYRQFMLGKSITAICKYLEDNHLPTPAGKEKWRTSTVYSILQNEKYKGDALLQKKFTVDFLQKKTKKNEGEVPQYYVEGSHEAIIPPNEFDMVQTEIKRRAEFGKKYSAANIFSTKLICGDCGGYYGSKVWHSTDKYRKTIWQCNNKFKGEKKCTTPTFDENEIKAKFMEAYNAYFEHKDEVVENCEMLLEMLTADTKSEEKISHITYELENLSSNISQLIHRNASEILSQEKYHKEYNALTEKYEKKSKKLEKAKAEFQTHQDRIKEIKAYIETIKKVDGYNPQWDDMLWVVTIEKAVVNSDGTIDFHFKDGKVVRM